MRVLQDDPALLDQINLTAQAAGSPSTMGAAEAAELCEWAEGEGHDGWPVELCAPPPVVETCACGQQFTLAHWQTLPWAFVWEIDGENLSHRRCYCGSHRSIKCTPPAEYRGTFKPAADATHEQRQAIGLAVEAVRP